MLRRFGCLLLHLFLILPFVFHHSCAFSLVYARLRLFDSLHRPHAWFSQVFVSLLLSNVSLVLVQVYIARGTEIPSVSLPIKVGKSPGTRLVATCSHSSLPRTISVQRPLTTTKVAIQDCFELFRV